MVTKSNNNISGAIAELQANAKARMKEVNPEKLVHFLEAQADIKGDVELLDYQMLTSGSGGSNGIAIFSCRLDMGQGSEARKFVLRYSPGVQLLKMKRFSDEFKTQQAAHNAGLPTPKARWLDESGEWLGCSGFVMDQVEGRSSNSAMYSSGLLAEVSNQERGRLMLDCVGLHGRIKRLAIGADQVPHLAIPDGRSAIEHELNRWCQELELLDLKGDPKKKYIQELANWLLEHQPTLRAPCLVHGDPQIANVMFQDGKLVALLDWELSWLGYAEADLAAMVLMKELFKIVDAPVEGVPTEEEYIARFEQESGTSLEHWPYFKLFETVKLLSVMLMSTIEIPSEQREDILGLYFDIVTTQWAETRKIYE